MIGGDKLFHSEDEQNVFLLYKYLNKIFVEAGASEVEAGNKTDDMILKHSSNLFGYKGLAYETGRMSLEFFCMYFLQDTFLPKENNAAAPIADVHRDIWNNIQGSIIGNGENQRGWILPRGTGKSAFGTYATACWCHAYGFKKYTLICSDIGSTAEKFIKDIKNTFLENNYIKQAFGVLLNDKDKRYICNSTQLEFINKTFIEAVSSTSSIRGRKYGNNRPDLIILDDFQSIEDCRTDDARQKKWNRYANDIKFAVQKPVIRNGKTVKKGTTLIALGTLQHKECFYSRLMKQPTWKFKNEKGVFIDDIDTYFNTGLWEQFKNILFDFKNETHLEDAKEFYYSNETNMKFPMLWAEFWDCLDMAMSYYENPASFKQEVQGDVDSIGEKWFKTVATESRQEIDTHSFTKTMLCMDPASTDNGKSDYSAYLVGSEAENNLKYARKAELARINARTDFDKYIDHAIELLKEYTDTTHVYIEKNTFNGADANLLENKINADDVLRVRNIEIINEMQRKNKDDKISTIIPYMNKGQIIFAEEDQDFIKQIMEFAGQKFSIHDDAPDITAEFANRIENIEVIRNVQLFDRRKLGV